MVRAVEESLKRLNTDHIDLLWAHMSDNVTPMEEILRSFDVLVRAGKIHYAGLSNEQVARLDTAGAIPLGVPHGIISERFALDHGADTQRPPVI